jgi:hypothetical protein
MSFRTTTAIDYVEDVSPGRGAPPPHGIGTASCGPGPLPQYHPRARPTEFSFVVSQIS